MTVSAVSTNPNYRFHHWTDQGSADGQSATRVIAPVEDPTVFTAFFLPVGRIVGVAQPPVAGSVTSDGADTDFVGARVTLTAISTNANYVFSRWSNGLAATTQAVVFASGMNVRTALFVSAVTLRASATPPEGGAIAATPLPPEGGVLSNGVKYASTATVTVTATPADGWRFGGWSDSATTNATRTAVLTTGTNLVASFVPIATLTAQASPAAGGLVSGGGTHDIETDATLTARPNDGWVFTGWMDDAKAATARVVHVTTNATYTATFAARIAVQANPQAAGAVTGGGVFRLLTVIDLSAVSTNAAYRFAQWQDGNTSAAREVTVTGPTNYTAIFTAVAAASAQVASAAVVSAIVAMPDLPFLALRVEDWPSLPSQPEGEQLFMVGIHLGQPALFVFNPDPTGVPVPVGWMATLDAQGADVNGNGLPDALEASLDKPLAEGAELLHVSVQNGSAVAETPFSGCWVIEPPAVPLGQQPAVWRLVPRAK